MRPTRMQLVGLIALAVVTVVLVGAAFVKPRIEAAAAAPESPIASLFAADPSATATPAAIRFAAVGDSISQGNSADFSAGDTGSLSWVTYAKGPSEIFAGGWAVHGATTTAMAAGVRHVDADVLVILAGTNDVGQGIPFATSAANLDKIVATFGAKRVIVSAIPPRNDKPQAVVDYNAALRQLAQQRGWTFIDAPAGVRAPDNTYAAGMTGSDGIHPTQPGAQIIGAALAKAIAS